MLGVVVAKYKVLKTRLFGLITLTFVDLYFQKSMALDFRPAMADDWQECASTNLPKPTEKTPGFRVNKMPQGRER